MTDTPCEKCGGRQWLPVDNLKSRACECLQKRNIHTFLGDEIWTAPRIPSPLYEPGENIDRTGENLFLRGRWEDILSHLQWCLTARYMNSGGMFTYKIITDTDIIETYTGSRDYRNRSKHVRDDVETFNSLTDIVSPPDLAIIRLGFLGSPNKAAGGALKQSLAIREVLRKPTWIIEIPSSPWHHSRTEDVVLYVDDHFQEISIGQVVSGTGIAPSIERAPEVAPRPFEPPVYSSQDEFRSHLSKGAGKYKPGGGKKQRNGPMGGDL